MKPPHHIVILSSGHHAGTMGHAGHPCVRTPALDRLAAAGTTFDAAFTPSPIAAAARAVCAPDHWQRARESLGDRSAPPGADAAFWIAALAADTTAAPGFLLVEPPTLAIDLAAQPTTYDPAAMPLPRLHPTEGYPRHPWVQLGHRAAPLDEGLDDADRQRLVAAYLDQCTALDTIVGRILAALDTYDLWRTTRVIYTSLVGHTVGARGIWRTPTLYDDHIAVPLLMAGSGLPAGRRCRTPVSLADLARTLAPSMSAHGRPLDDIATAPDETTRTVVATCPASAGSSDAAMIRDGRFKYIAYRGFEPELFDLAADPGEEENLARSPALAPIRERLARRLEAAVPTLDLG